MQTIKNEWHSYLDRCIPGDAGDIQVRETRRAFYAGAAALFKLLNTPTAKRASTQAMAAKMATVKEELVDFKWRIGKDL